MIIREATISDIDAISNLYDEIHTAEENGLQTIGWIRDVYPTRKTAEDSVRRGDMFVLEEGDILGSAIINRIQVDAYEWASEHGLPELRLDTNARNTVARAMYKRLGYTEIGIVPTVFNGIEGVDLVLLEKNLDHIGKEDINDFI